MKHRLHIRTSTALALFTVGAVVLVGCTTAPSGSETAPAQSFASLDEVCAAAESEGTMEAWLNFTNVDPIIAAFKQAYPNVKMEVLTILAEDATPRLVTESVSGQAPTADVIYGNLPALAPLINRDLINADVDWESIGVPAELVNEQGTVRIAQVGYGLGYNSDKYSADDLPNTWNELLDPKWNGKLILDPRGRPFSFLSVNWGTDQAVQYVQKMIDTLNPIVIQGTSAGLTALVAGDGDILLNSKTAETAQFQADGAPVAIKLLDEIPVEGTQLGLLAGADQPLAAQCFIGWSATQEGSDAIFAADFKTNVLPDVPAGATYVEIKNAEELAVSDATIQQLSAIITGGEG